jgi:hypothetical protein
MFLELLGMREPQQQQQQQQLHLQPRSRQVYLQRVAALPVAEVYDVGTMADKECQVCLSGYALGDTFKTLPCLHFYHADCIDPWLKTNSHCPVCQTRVDGSLDATSLS